MRGTVLTLCRVVIVGAVAVGGLGGCGRRGAPITPEAAAAEDAQRASGSIIPMPDQRRDPEKLPKPKRDFLLDPLL